MKRLVLFIFFFFGIFFILKPLFSGLLPDFNVYYVSAAALLGGKDVYSATTQMGLSFIYPPFALFFILPFVLFPYALAQTLWTGVSILFFFTSLVLLFRIEKEKLFSNRFLLLAGLALYSFPAKFTLGMGQINMLILLFMALFLYFLQSKRFTPASIFLSASLNTKLFPIFFIFPFFIKRRWKLLLYSLLISSLFFLFSFVFFRPFVIDRFFINVLPGLVHSTRSDYYNQALSGFVFRLFRQSPTTDMVISLLSLCFLGVSLHATWKSAKEYNMIIFGFFITLQLLIGSFSWQHYFVWLLIPYIQIAYILIKKKSLWRAYIPIAISFFLTQSNLKNPGMVPVLFQSHVFYGALILWGYILYLLLRYDKMALSH